MELFSEIYSCYYQVLRHLLLTRDALTLQDIRSLICGEGFEEPPTIPCTRSWRA